VQSFPVLSEVMAAALLLAGSATCIASVPMPFLLHLPISLRLDNDIALLFKKLA